MALRAREKKLLLLAGIAVAILVFDQLYYTPQSRKIARLKEEIKALEGKMEEQRLLRTSLEALESEIARLEEETKGIESLTLGKEGLKNFLTHLARESDRLPMKIVSLSPEGEKPQADSEKEESLPYKRVRLRLVLHSPFHSLAAYVRSIEELPFFVRLSDFQVEREERIAPLLKATLRVTVYVWEPGTKESR